ncbi:hypothetical protein B484DRAFT_416460, partial [Ochromonadaceae sp. CCMP2298]
MVIMKKGQNERRREALCDVYNFISLAVMMLIVYAHISGVSVREMERLSMDELQQDPRWVATVDRRLIFNIDKSTTFLGNTQDQLGFVAAGSKERLREKSRNATFQKTGEEDTRRSLGYTALTNAAGELIFFITHLRDHAFNGTASQKRPAKIHKMMGTGGKLYVMTNGTSFATDATEEAQLVFELVLEVIKELRKTNAAEDREALSMPVAVGSFAPTAPAPNANVHEEEDDGQTSAAGDTRGSPGGSETPTTSMNYETLEHFMEREHVQEEESAMATNDGFILPAAVSPSRRRSPRGSPPARRQRVHSPRAEVAAAVAGVLQRDDADEAGEEAREVIRKAMLLLDGEYNQIKMSMEEGGFGAQCRQDDVLLMKLAASCSKTQQPNDVMKAFAILHAFFCSEKFRHLNVTNMRRPAYMDQISSITREVPPASRALFHKYFMILDAIAGDAFKPSIIIKGWTAAG